METCFYRVGQAGQNYSKSESAGMALPQGNEAERRLSLFNGAPIDLSMI